MSFVGIAIGTTVASVGMGLVQANQAKQAQKGAMGQQQAMWESDKAFRDAQYADEKNRRDKAEAPLWAELNQSDNVAFGKYKGNIENNFDNAGRRIDQQVAGAKMAGSGLDLAAHQGNELERAKSLSAAWRQGRADKTQLAGFLAGRTNTLAAGQSVSQGNQAQANYYGDQANQWGRAAQAGWGAAAQGLGNLYSMGKNAGWWGTTPPPAAMPAGGGAPTGSAFTPNTSNWGISTGYKG